MCHLKDSGIEWIGKIPANWQRVKFNALYINRNEKVSDKEYRPLSVTKKGIVPQLETAAKTNDNDNRKLVKVGDFVINSRSDRRGSCGISKLNGSVSLINTVLAPRNDQMVPRYYDWLFHTVAFSDEFYKWGHGIVDDLWTTNWNDMKNITLILPTRSEQQKIADFLDRKCMQIDKLMSNISAEIELLENYRNSFIAKTVTKGLGSNVCLKESNVAWIGKVPQSWEIEKLKYLVDNVDKGISPQYSNENDYDVRIITQSSFSQGSLNDEGVRFAKGKMSKNSRGAIWRGDVLLATTGGGVLGKTYYYDENKLYFASADVARIRPNSNKFLGKLIYYILSINYELMNNTMSQGSTNQIHLNMSLLRNMKLPCPDFGSQVRIVNYLDEKCSEIEHLIEQKKQQIDIISHYKNSLIFDYVTGKREI